MSQSPTPGCLSPPIHSPSLYPHPPTPPPGPQSPSTPSDFDQSDSEDGSGPNRTIGEDFPPATLPKIRTALEFIKMVEVATLATQFDPDGLTELLEPVECAVSASHVIWSCDCGNFCIVYSSIGPINATLPFSLILCLNRAWGTPLYSSR
jgi:hypothetical protein